MIQFTVQNIVLFLCGERVEQESKVETGEQLGNYFNKVYIQDVAVATRNMCTNSGCTDPQERRYLTVSLTKKMQVKLYNFPNQISKKLKMANTSPDECS